MDVSDSIEEMKFIRPNVLADLPCKIVLFSSSDSSSSPDYSLSFVFLLQGYFVGMNISGDVFPPITYFITCDSAFIGPSTT